MHFLKNFRKKHRNFDRDIRKIFGTQSRINIAGNTENNFSAKQNYIITESDFKQVARQVSYFENSYTTKFACVNVIKKKISEALLVPSCKIPDSIVTINSIVLIKLIKTGTLLSLKLVLSEFENYREHKLSLFSALGAAVFLGKVGDNIEYSTWKTDNQIKIIDIPYQPEANGEFWAKR